MDIYSGSDDIKKVANNAHYLCDVMTKHPNRLGIYDMSGNVSEWCWDKYEPKYERYRQSPHDPSETVKCSDLAVIRGGGCYSDLEEFKIENRDSAEHSQIGYIGIRLVSSSLIE